MVRKVSSQIRKLLNRPKASVFLMFLVISFFIWFLITLSDTYVSQLNFKPTYSGIPEEKLLLGTPTTKIKATVQATGFKLMNYKLFRRSVELPYEDFKKQGDSAYILASDIEAAISTQHKSLLVRRIDKDSVKLILGENKKKNVPVVSKVLFSFEEDFELSDSITLEPDSIWVRGPEDVMAKVEFVETVVKSYKNVHDNFNYTIDLHIPDTAKKLTYERKDVVVSAQVERYSEKIIEVEVQVKNLPEHTSIKLYPQRVRLLCKSPISELKNITGKGFLIQCDFRDAKDGAAYLIPRIIDRPDFVSSVKLLDTKIEFLTKTTKP